MVFSTEIMRRKVLSAFGAGGGADVFHLRPSYKQVGIAGLLGDGLADDTEALQKLFSIGGFLPAAHNFYRTTDTLYPGDKVSVTGAGRKSLIRLDRPGGSPAIPTIDCRSDVSGVTLENFAVDVTNPSTLIAPEVYHGNKIAGSAILVQADDTVLSKLWISNAWDNGLAVAACAEDRSGPLFGQPRAAFVRRIRTYSCGSGSGAGAGVNIGTGINTLASDIVDHKSKTGFAIDYDGGASGMISNVICISPAIIGIYVGSSDCQIMNVKVIGGASNCGLFLDHHAERSQICNVAVKNVLGNGVYLKGSLCYLTNIFVFSSGLGSPGNYDGFLVEVEQGSDMTLCLVNCAVVGDSQRYGLAAKIGSKGTLNLRVSGEPWHGRLASFSEDALKAMQRSDKVHSP